MIESIVERMKALKLPADAGYVIEGKVPGEGELEALFDAIDAAGLEYHTVCWWPAAPGDESIVVREMTPEDFEAVEEELADDLADAIEERLHDLEAEPGQCFLVGGPLHADRGTLVLVENRLKGVRLLEVLDEAAPEGGHDDIVVMRVSPSVFDAVAAAVPQQP